MAVSQYCGRVSRPRAAGSWLAHARLSVIAVVTTLLITSVGAQVPSRAAPVPTTALSVRLADSVLPAVARGIARPVAARGGEATQPLTLTVVLRRADELGFEQFLIGVQNPASLNYRHFLSQHQLADRFGPSQGAYDTVLAWLSSQGFTLVQGSANRLTLTVAGTRQRVEQALQVRVRTYRLGGRTFYANDRAPTVPLALATDIQTIAGLSNLAQPLPPVQNVQTTIAVCGGGTAVVVGIGLWSALAITTLGLYLAVTAGAVCAGFAAATGTVAGGCAVAETLFGASVFGSNIVNGCNHALTGGPPSFSSIRGRAGAAAPSKAMMVAPAASRISQKIGLLEFDTFHPSDVQNWLSLLHADPTLANRVSVTPVNGGVGSPGPGESEVLLDIDTALLFDALPSTSYAVYTAPRNTSFAQVFNAMINDGDTVISNSWSQCEDQTSLSDAQGIDAVLAQAAASGISVFNGSGDTGSTCLDGSPNTVGVPADSPHATAVGGTTPLFGQGAAYGGERWWDGSTHTPPSGQGGFGVSRYFPRPAYQDGLTTATMRSVPDLAAIADPAAGLGICQADAGGCPTGLFNGGTSLAAPEMAAMTALLNQLVGFNLGQANPVLYPLASSNAFHSAASMGSDFAHVGLGSPNLDYLRLALNHQTIGPASAATSLVAGSGSVSADGTTQGTVQVDLLDANGYPVSGKTVTLLASAGSHAVVAATSGPSSVNGGAVTFSVSDAVSETVTFTATDTSDGVTLSTQPTLQFVPPPATGGSITASPGNVPADGATPLTVTVTLQNAQGQGAQGKTVLLSQGTGHAVLVGSGVTDASGTATFQATDLAVEAVTFTATDVTDGNLPVPGSAQVSFTSGGGANVCPVTNPSASTGFAVSTFASGFYDGNLAHLAECGGPATSTFDASGNLYVPDIITGDIFKFGPGGGVATGATRVTATPLGAWLITLAFGKNGDLYALQTFTSGPGGQGQIYQIDPANGSIVRTVASSILGPTSMAVDPLSGDLFVGNGFNGGPQTPDVVRIHDAGPGNPPTDCTNFRTNTSGCTVYAVPGEVDFLSFDPDGTIYARGAGTTGYNGYISAISGTNTTSPGTVTVLTTALPGGGSATVLQPAANGRKAILGVSTGSALDAVDLNQSPLQPVPIMTPFSGGIVGPDGCIYAGLSNSILKITSASGSCPYAPASVGPHLQLGPAAISPNPTTGSTVTFTATLSSVSAPQGAPILFTVSGANPQVKLVQADASGQATFTYTGAFIGTDQVFASTAIVSTTLSSSATRVTWAAGQHVSFVGLNVSPTGGQASLPVTLRASLSDVGVNPATALGGATLTLQLGNQSCVATTDSTGIGSCVITLNQAPGLYTLTARFAGDGAHTANTTSAPFVVTQLLPATPTATGTSLPTATTTPSQPTATSTPLPSATAPPIAPTPTSTPIPLVSSTPSPTAVVSVPPTAAVGAPPTTVPVTRPVGPTLRLNRRTAALGDRLCATGTGFQGGEPVTIAVNGVAVAQVSTSTAGGFTACFRLPGSVVAGPNDVSALGARSHTLVSAQIGGLFARTQASTAYFAGASTAAGDETDLALLNPQSHAARVALRFYLPGNRPFDRSLTVPAHARATLHLSRYVARVRGFGLRVQADRVIATQMIVRRGHANPYTSLGSGLLSTRWYLAEGYTNLTFHESLYVLNPNTAATSVQVRLLPFNGRAARTVRVTVPAQRVARLDVNRLYPHVSLATIITSDHPTSVERVLTFGNDAFGATGDTGAPLAATTWLFAEGSAAHGLQTFLTILNPGRAPATVTALFYDTHGRVLGRRTIVVQGLHRSNMRLNDTTHLEAIATTLTSTQPVVVERPFYLGNPNARRMGATLVFGRNGTGQRWTFPAGDTTHGAHEDLLVLNPNAGTLRLRVTFYTASGRVVARTVTVPGNARFTLHVNTAAPGLASSVHGTQMISTDNLGFIAEQSIYDAQRSTAYGAVGVAQ